MELNKNYPWLGNLKISDKDIQKWQEKNREESLTFWALKNKSLNQKAYFNWAVDHYQTPFLKDIFFEQNLMTKIQWNEIKDLFDWTEEILPVAVWNRTVFIGCLEPPKRKIEVLGFDTRFVLISYQSLQVIWKFSQSLLRFIEKEITKSLLVKDLGPEIQALESKMPTEKPLDKLVMGESSLKAKQTLSPEMPVEKPLDKPVMGESSLKATQTLGPEMPTDKPLASSEEHTSFPEQEEERAVEDNNTFPGRIPSEDNILVMEDVKPDNKKPVKEQTETDFNKDSQVENTNFTFFGNSTLTYLSYNYEELWKYTKSFYCTSLILKVKNDKVYPISWAGRIKGQKTEDISVDLNDYSLFRIVQKGHSYNGFVVDNPVNKKFFSQIGWSEYPKHVTAIPIKNSEQHLTNIFVGFSLEPISMGKTRKIEENVLTFFRKNSVVSQAA